MATPIKEDIAADLLTALNLVTTGNGFEHTIVGTRTFRVDYATRPPEGNTFILAPGEEEELDTGISKKAWLQHFIIVLIVQGPDFTTTTIETQVNQIEADIRKKLREDPQRSTLALDTIINPSTQLQEDVDFTGLVLNIAVHYRHNEDDPYTA